MGADIDIARNRFSIGRTTRSERERGKKPIYSWRSECGRLQEDIKNLGEDAGEMGEVETKNAWELILDNIPKGRDRIEKMEEAKIERDKRRERQ